RHQYGNTETSDLWSALEAETGEPVTRIAESWIFQGGFPEVTVEPDGGGGASGRAAPAPRRPDPSACCSTATPPRWPARAPATAGSRPTPGPTASTGCATPDPFSTRWSVTSTTWRPSSA